MTGRREFLRWITAGTLGLWLPSATKAKKQNKRPNILWLVAEDMNPWLSCYGETLIQTSTLDAMAAKGVRFNRAYVTAPVCSPCRSALITGCLLYTSPSPRD